VDNVLGSARTGLIFTGIQEGTPGRGTAGRADPTWPNRAGYSIPCAVMLGSGWGKLGGGNSLAAREGRAAVRSERAVLFCWLCSAGLFCVFPFFCIIVVPVPFVCCSVKLPLSRHTGFLRISFHSLPHHGRGRGGRVALLLAAAVKTRTHWKCLISGWTRL